MNISCATTAIPWIAAIGLALPLVSQDLLWQAQGIGGQLIRGADLHRMGDFNHDGWEDLLERGASWTGQYGLNAMRITSGRDGSILSSGAPAPQGWAISNTAPLGDMNQDGVLDYGAHIYDGSNPVTTQTLGVFSGSTHTTLWTAMIPNAWGTSFAAVLAGDLDANGDGRNDVVTSAFNLSPFGTILVYDNSGTELYRLIDPVPNIHVGLDIANIRGDLDGDGCGDFLASGIEPGGRGAVVCFSGRTGAVLRISVGAQSGDGLINVGPCGDIDQDGVPDYCGGGSSGAAVVTAFSGATGQIIHSWRDPRTCCMGINVTGGFDLDADGVPDLIAGTISSNSAPLDRIVSAFSGRDGSILFQWYRSVNYFTCLGESVAMLAAPPGDPYAVAVFSERCWSGLGNPCTSNAYCPGLVRAYRGSPKGVHAFGAADASPNQPLARSGMRSPTTATSPTVRFTISDAAPGAVCVLQIGLSDQSLRGLALPAPLDPLGFPGITLLTSWEATLCTVAGTVGMDRGFAQYNMPLPPGRVIDTSGTPVHAQWIWFDPTNTANHGSTAGQRFLLR